MVFRFHWLLGLDVSSHWFCFRLRCDATFALGCSSTHLTKYDYRFRYHTELEWNSAIWIEQANLLLEVFPNYEDWIKLFVIDWKIFGNILLLAEFLDEL